MHSQPVRLGQIIICSTGCCSLNVEVTLRTGNKLYVNVVSVMHMFLLLHGNALKKWCILISLKLVTVRTWDRTLFANHNLAFMLTALADMIIKKGHIKLSNKILLNVY